MATQITHDFPPFFRVHSTGKIERYFSDDFLPPSHDPQTDVLSKDILISPENNISARIYLPKNYNSKHDPKKQPLIIYIHGGAFSIQSAFSSIYHPYINTLSSKTGFVVVSAEYRLAPEHPIPACYDDSWAVIEWVVSGSDPWINEFVDLNRVYFAGDSAGANIAHNMAIRVSNENWSQTRPEFGLSISGLVLIHPYFGTRSAKTDKLWSYICPGTSGANDVRYNPGADMDLLKNLRCERILVCVAEKDGLKRRGLYYYQTMKKSGWKGEIDLFESPGEDHVFHFFDPGCQNALALLDRVTRFMNNPAPFMSRL